LLAQRANVDRYPPVLHQLRQLDARFDSTVVDLIGDGECDEACLPSRVQRIRVRASHDKGPLAAVRRLAEMFVFSRTVNEQIARKPDVAIAYDAESAALLLRATTEANSSKRVVHLHELFDTANAGGITRRAMRYLEDNLRRADLVVVPDAHRATMVAESFALPVAPMVVMNFPPLLQTLPTSRLIPALRDRGVMARKIVHYQGSVGPDHCLEAIVASMKFWPADAVFVVIGGGSEEYRKRLSALAASAGVAKRLIILGRVPYSEVLSFAVGASIGLTLLEPTIDNQRFCAGASNKRFEYAALGIPQVTNSGTGMAELFGEPGLAVLVESLDPASIGRAVADLLGDPQRAIEMGERARAAHLRANNYESQFAPVREVIESWLRDDR
jgi:glycosyltransferase involved in cell wall biosynthesis